MNLTSIMLPAKLARLFYAAALLAFGIQHFIFGVFIAGRPMPWPAELPGELAVAYVSGALLIFAALALVVNKRATELLIAVSILILLWAGMRNIFHVISTLDYGEHSLIWERLYHSGRAHG